MTQMLSDHPELIGKFETLFTCDMEKAKGYTGTISHADITGKRVAIATDFGTANKRKNLELVEKYLYSGELSQEESEVLNFLKSV